MIQTRRDLNVIANIQTFCVCVSLLFKVFLSPAGFTEPLKQCLVRTKDGKVAAICENPSKYISWDGMHYTEAANHFVAKSIINGSLSDPPVSIANACHKNAFM